MGFRCGIVGLPNVGKSTLFNALCAAQVPAANYPFCTIDPNVGVVSVPDARFDQLAALVKKEHVIHATLEFVDVAGLVRGASRGEGRGNQFLGHLREMDALAHVVRCFEDVRILHVDGSISPTRDIETVEAELLLADLATAERALDAARTRAKSGVAAEKKAAAQLEHLVDQLGRGVPARRVQTADESHHVLQGLHLLTAKPTLFVANVRETELPATLAGHHPMVREVKQLAESRGDPCIPACAELEAQVQSLAPRDRPEFLAAAGLKEPGLHAVVREGYRALQLITFFTVGAKETRAWTLPAGTKAPQAAGRIHTDFERGFIKAEVVRWDDLLRLGSEAACRAAGKLAVEGRDYVVQDGDVIHFRFNV